MSVMPGIEVLVRERPELVRGQRVGLLAHPASVDSRLCHAASLLTDIAGARVERLFAPEHGAAGALQDMIASEETRDPLTGLPVVSLYGDDASSLSPSPELLEGLDLVVADLVDIGARYYTFAATVLRMIEEATKLGLRVIVADRPNPIGGLSLEGNLIAPAQRSFVGEISVANRHGMTLGELCLYAVAERGLDPDLELIPARGWRRELWADQTGLAWVLPSPNMPTLDTATVYPGACLIESTNLSEGRGTTRPFELVGAPWIDGVLLAKELTRLELPGVIFRPLSFLPTFQKHAGQACGGVQLHLRDRSRFRPLLTGLALLIEARRQDPERFRWRSEEYEFVSDQPAIDLLAGTPSWRKLIEAGAEARDIEASWVADLATFEERRASVLVYS